jgi:Golgi phosphoprotein 3 GPP34
MSVELEGTALVADDLYLLAHHEVTGNPLLQPGPLSIGLAGGLLAELMVGGSISLRHDGATVARRSWPADDLARHVRDQIAAEREPRLVREWLLLLARNAREDVAGRLGRSGYTTRVGRRIPWRSRRWVPVDAGWAVAAVLRVRTVMDPTRPPASYEAALAGLALACGLGFRLDQYQTAADRSVEEAVGQLRPDLRELIAETRAAIDCPAVAPAERSSATFPKWFAGLRARGRRRQTVLIRVVHGQVPGQAA